MTAGNTTSPSTRASGFHRADVRAVPLARVEVADTGVLEGARENLSMPDRSYVVTRPGEALQVRFDVGAVPEGRKGGVVKTRLIFVPYTAMEDVDFDQLNLRVVAQPNASIDDYDYRPPSVRDREKIRLLSRFPQGLSAPLLDQLLEATGQTAVEVISGN